MVFPAAMQQDKPIRHGRDRQRSSDRLPSSQQKSLSEAVHWIGEGNRYRLERRLGGGGMGSVFLATDTRLGKQVALKVLKESLANDKETIERFEWELAICAALKSQHIVQVSDYGLTPEGYPFYVMEYLHGQTLGQQLEQQQRLSPQQTCLIMTQVCAGLQLAHEGIAIGSSTGTFERIKVVHRDLKPENIFLVPTALGDLVKIIDFGIAKIRHFQVEQTKVTNLFLGTCHYAAPEQFEGTKDLDERADIYSLGLILYEMLSGCDPFGFNFRQNQVSGESWLLAHVSKPPKPLRLQPDCEQLSPELEAAIMRCLQKSPQNRFSSVIELSQALQAAVLTAAGRSKQPVRNSPSHGECKAAPEPPLQGGVPMTQSDSASQSISSNLMPLPPVENASIAVPEPVNNFVGEEESEYEDRSKAQSLLRQVFWLLIGGGLFLTLGIGFYYLPQLFDRASAPQVELVSNKRKTQFSLAQKSAGVSSGSRFEQARSLSGHNDLVWSVAWSADGQTLVSGSEDKTVRVWNVDTGQSKDTIPDHTNPVRAIALSSDGTLLASTNGGQTIKLWNLQTGELVRTFNGHQSTIWSVAISPDKTLLASASSDKTIKLWNLQTGKPIRNLAGHTNWVFSVSFSPNGRTLASASKDSTVKLWDVKTGEERFTLTGHQDVVRDAAFAPTGQHLASVSWDGTVKIWDLLTQTELHTLSGHSDRVISVAFSPDGKTLASGSVDRTIKLWDWKNGILLNTLSGHADWVLSLAFSPSGNTLVSGSKDKTLKIWQR